MLWKVFSDDPIWLCGVIEDKAVIAKDCPDEEFAEYKEADDAWMELDGTHRYANFDPELAEKHNLRTE